MRHFRLFLALLFLPVVSYGQTVVSGHIKLPDPTVSPVNVKVCVTLTNFKPNVPRVVGTGQLVNTTNYCVTPATDGSYSFQILGNNVITPTTTNWRVDWLFNGIQTSSAIYLINHSPFNLDTEIPLNSSTPAGPNQLILNVFPFTQLTPSSTWTIPHNFNDPNTIAFISGLSGNDIYADTKTCRIDPNNCTVTFVTPTAGFAIAVHAAQISIASTQPNAIVSNPIGAQTTNGQPLSIGGPLSITSLNGEQWLATNGSVASAIAALPSGGTIHIPAGTYPIPATISLVSNLDIECAPNNATILQATASLNAPMFSGSSINNFRMAGCVVDGNRSGNANQFSAILLTSVTQSKIIANHFQNFSGGRVVYLSSGSNSNTVQDNEINNYGPPLPAVANGNECIALAPSGSGAGVQDNDIIHNSCHDGNGGVGIYNSNAAPSATANTSDNRILDNKIRAMPNDAILLFNSSAFNTGSLIQGTLIKGNTVKCNGWPANGTGWDSTNCPPGLNQTGASAGQGVGINLNSSLQDQTQVIGNRASYNFYEGGDDTPQTNTTVNTQNAASGGCASNCIVYVSGDSFITTLRVNQSIIVNGAFFNVVSVQGATSTITVSQAPGTQTSVRLTQAPCDKSIWSGNYFFNNGNGAPLGGQGAGLAIMGCDVTSEGNFAYNNAYAGFYDQIAANVSHNSDHAFQNGRIQAVNEFQSQQTLNAKYIGVTSDARAGNNALFFSGGTFNGFALSESMCTPSGCGASAVQDQGTNDVFDDGKTRGASNTNGATHSLCFSATGGTGCLNYGGGAGSFALTLPGANDTLAGITAAQTLTNKTIGGFTNGTGLQAFSTSTTCTTGAAAGNTCTTAAITLPVGYADTAYRIGCSGITPTNVPTIIGYTKTNTTFQIAIVTVTAAAATYASFDCWAEHN